MTKVRSFTSQSRLVIALAGSLLMLSACTDSDVVPTPNESFISQEVPAVTSRELEYLLLQTEQPVLVEFGVTVGCPRCDDMRPQLQRLACEFDGEVRVVRVDFNTNRRLAAQYGGNICPSYVLFDAGNPVATHTYPTSAGLIAADLDAVIDEQPALGAEAPHE